MLEDFGVVDRCQDGRRDQRNSHDLLIFGGRLFESFYEAIAYIAVAPRKAQIRTRLFGLKIKRSKEDADQRESGERRAE